MNKTTILKLMRSGKEVTRTVCRARTEKAMLYAAEKFLYVARKGDKIVTEDWDGDRVLQVV